MRNRWLAVAFLSLLGAASVGCANVTMKTGRPRQGAKIEQNLKFFIYGLVGTEEVNLRELCPNGVSEIHQVATFGDMCLGCITIGIYTPRTVEITCSGGGTAYRMDVDADGRMAYLEPIDANMSVAKEGVR